MMEKIKIRYRSSGIAVFTSLDRTYQDLRLCDYTDVSKYAEKLRKAKNELLELDPSCTIGHPHFVNKFLTGLGPDDDVFFATFNQTRLLIPPAAMDGQPAILAVILVAEKEEQRIKHQEEPKTALLSSKSNHSVENQAIVTVPYCMHCHKNYHIMADCWDLHPEKRKAADKKRHANHDRKPAKKQRKNNSEDDNV